MIILRVEGRPHRQLQTGAALVSALSGDSLGAELCAAGGAPAARPGRAGGGQARPPALPAWAAPKDHLAKEVPGLEEAGRR